MIRPSLAFALVAALISGDAIGQTIAPFLEIDGRPSPAKLHKTATSLNRTVHAQKAGTYRYGVAIAAPEISLLGPGTPSYNCENLKEPLTVRYPYDWTWNSPKGNVLSARPRLIMPGVQVNGRLYVADTHELFSVTLEPCGNGRDVRALLLAHRSFNDGADRATTDLRLHAGDTSSLTINIYPNLGAVNRARFGRHEAMSGLMTQPAYREWVTEPLTEAGYDKIGRGLSGVYQYIIVREIGARPYIPKTLHKYKLLAIHYEYMGALRRHSTEVTPEIQAEIRMKDTSGQLYTAPTAPNGNWLLGDIRRPEVRARFINNARAAIRAGYDGVFLDGYPFWNDATGKIGGNVPAATHSWAYARWQLLHATKEAIRKENPKATFGLLSNQYFDSLGEADWAMKERMYFEWDGGHSAVKVQSTLDHAFEANEAPYAAEIIGYGAKGADPVAVQTEIHFFERPNRLIYTDPGDFPEADLDHWITVERSVMSQKDLYIAGTKPPDCWVHFPQIGSLETDNSCDLQFSENVCVSTGGRDQKPKTERQLSTRPTTLYRINRDCKEK